MCFTWGTARHFSRRAGKLAGASAISVLSLADFAVFLWQVIHGALGRAWLWSCSLFVCAVALWLWAVLTSRATPPTLAFTNDRPNFLLAHGPYRFVRHPFYVAYMMFWIGAAIATRSLWNWALAVMIGTFYWLAACYEERKFASSGLAADYRAYTRRTGRFLPRIWFRRHSHQN